MQHHDSDYHAGVYSAQRDHPRPGAWASRSFRAGFADWAAFRTPVCVREVR